MVCLSLSLPVLAAPDAKGAEAQRAQEIKEMKEHFKAGLTHYSLGEFAEAATDFREAYRIHAEPAILFNIAQTMRQMNDYHHAYFYYAQYLSQRPDAANRSEVEQFMSAMKGKMDDEDQMKAAQSAAAPAAIARGSAGGEKVAVVSAEPKPGAAGQTTAAPPIAVVAPPIADAKSDTFWTAPHIGGVIAGGGAVALGAVALISHASAVSSANQLNQEYQAGTLTAQDSSVKSDVDSKGKLATIGAVGGAALLVTGALLVFAF